MDNDTMIAVRQHVAGGPLSVEQMPIPVPRRGEVLVRIAASPVNPSDLSFIHGKYGSPDGYPFTPGFEGSGTVVSGGGGILTRLRTGKRVACTPDPGKDGTWAEYMVTSAERCIPLSEKISMEQGSMMVVNPMTAMALLEIARNGGHKAIVNNAAASALGKMLLALCHKLNIPLICIVNSRDQENRLKNIGARYILNSTDPGYTEALSGLCEKLNATLLLDAIGGKAGTDLVKAAPSGSRIILYAKLSGESIEVDPRDLLRREKVISGFQLGNYLDTRGLLYKLRLVSRVRKFFEEQDRVVIQGSFSILEINEAIELYKIAMGKGKVLVVP